MLKFPLSFLVIAGWRTSLPEICQQNFDLELTFFCLYTMGCIPSKSKVSGNIMHPLSLKVAKDKSLPSEVTENKHNVSHEDFSALASETTCK